MQSSRRTWVEIDLDAILYNYNLIHSRIDNTKIMAVVKADAYGHGDIAVAHTLQEAGTDWFAVSNLDEAVRLREQGITKPILILGYTPPDEAATLSAKEITQTVYSLEYAHALNDSAIKSDVKINCHIKLDTGMSRIGFCVCNNLQGVEEVTLACALPALNYTGIFTHFACADEPTIDSDNFTKTQFKTYINTVKALENRGINFLLHHCCNSAALLRFPEMHLDIVRAGVILYGLSPAPECEALAKLQPAMRFYSTVTMVKNVESGTQISYGRTYEAIEPRKVATIAVGYADGFRRNFSNVGHVISHGKYAPIVGRICMDQCLIDVTQIPEVQMGDRVTLVGEDETCHITFDDFANLNNTINYEEICLIGRRVPRVYIKNKKECGVTDYLLQIIKK